MLHYISHIQSAPYQPSLSFATHVSITPSSIYYDIGGNKIEALKNEDGSSEYDATKIKMMDTSFYQKLHREEGNGLDTINFGLSCPELSHRDISRLRKNIGKLI